MRRSRIQVRGDSTRRGRPSFRAAYAALLAQHPLAQRALERRYQSVFHLSPAQARTMAAYALDFALRSAYHFQGSSNETVPAAGPWPENAARG
jgi:hypothetical protein